MSAALEWVTGRDTGASSMALWSHMMTGRSTGEHPHDADDFGRIARLLDLVPEWRARVPEMARYSREWAALVAHWDALDALYRAWWFARDRGAWSAFYEALRDAFDEYVRCAWCGGSLRSGWKSIGSAGRVCWPCDRVGAGGAP